MTIWKPSKITFILKLKFAHLLIGIFLMYKHDLCFSTQLSMDDKQKNIINELISMNVKIKKMNLEFDKVLKQKEYLEADQNKSINEIKSVSEKLIEKRKLLSTRVKTIGKFKGENIVKTMLAHPQLSKIEHNVKIMGLIAANDIYELDQFQKDRLNLKLNVEKTKSRIEYLSQLEITLENKKNILNKEYNNKIIFLSALKKSDLFSEKQILSLIQKSKNMDIKDMGLFDLFSSQSMALHKNKLVLPVVGEVDEKFGIQDLENFKGVNNHGTFISSIKGSDVRSIFEGKVMQIGQMDGLGHFLVLDHGDNYYSIYGNLQNINVKINQTINTGETFAKTDDKYIENKSGLYFEMRHYSKALDPEKWVRGWYE